MPKITTIGSHSSLQIIKGAKDEGLETILITTKKQEAVYKELFPIADEIITLDSYKDFFDVEQRLMDEDAIIVPHGSFVAYVDQAKHDKMKVKYFGNKDVLKWEGDRHKQMEWLSRAGLNLPKLFQNHKEIDRPTIVKLFGAGGGSGYFFVSSPEEFEREVEKRGVDPNKLLLQEYVVGCPTYIHYFYSPLDDRLEIMSLDRRYETNVDGIGRLSLTAQEALRPDPSYVVIGNSPLVIRESLLSDLYQMGHNVINVSKEICPPQGLYGPFCLETVVTPDQQFYMIEISARIVAGTNLYINGSPYSDLNYDTPMSTGRRIALEVRRAEEQGRLEEIV
jgi:5-formaminoimidazole-4-carboxamide-1-(beta)-D-ribofuranosyl 5'-monophosphate synthetase